MRTLCTFPFFLFILCQYNALLYVHTCIYKNLSPDNAHKLFHIQSVCVGGAFISVPLWIAPSVGSLHATTLLPSVSLQLRIIKLATVHRIYLFYMQS